MNFIQAIVKACNNKGIEQHGKIFRAYVYVNGEKRYLGNFKEWSDANQTVINFWIERFICGVTSSGLNPDDGVVIKDNYVLFPGMRLFNLRGYEIKYDVYGGRLYIVHMNGRQYSIRKIYKEIFGEE